MTTEITFNREALIRRADSFISSYNVYPHIPEGDLSFEFIQNVVNFDPLYRLSQLKEELLKMLMDKTDYEYSESAFGEVIAESYEKRETELAQDILKWLIESFKTVADRFSYRYSSYMSMRPCETLIFYYAYSIYYIGKKLKNGDALLFARNALMALDVFQCEKSTTPFDGIGSTGKMLSLGEFRNDAKLYHSIMSSIEAGIEALPDNNTKKKLKEAKSKEKKTRGRQRTKSIFSVLLRIVITLCFPLLLKYSSTFFDVTEFDSWIVTASSVILMVFTLFANIRFKNIILVLILNIAFAALIYPMCMLVSFAAIYVIFVVIGILFCGWSITKS